MSEGFEISIAHDARGYPAFYVHGLSGDGKRDGGDLRAKAHLFATSPLLMEALQEARVALNAWATVAVDEYPKACRESARLVEGIDAVLAKATEGAA